MRNIYCSCGYTATSRDDHDDHVVSVSRYDNTDHYETTNRTG